MIVAGVVVATAAAFVTSSVYYTAVTPLEHSVLGDAAPHRGRPSALKAVTELARTAMVAGVFAWLASRADLQTLPGVLALAAILWAGFPLALLTGAVLWEGVAPVTAAIHSGDWLLKLLLIAAVISPLH